VKKIAVVVIFLFVTLLLFSIQVFAKPKIKIVKSKDRIIYKKNTIINFEGDVVNGELIKPKGSFFQGRGRAKFNSLIMYRKDFLDKMIKQAKKL